MISTSARRAIESVLRHEGGYVNHPSDPGGETNMGISRRAYPDEDIAGMTVERAAELYHRDYWLRIRGDELPPALAFAAMDAAVNSGVRRAAQWLQSAVGATPDGAIGPATIRAAAGAPAEYATRTMCHHRLEFLRALATWPTFGRGWERRVLDVMRQALELVR